MKISYILEFGIRRFTFVILALLIIPFFALSGENQPVNEAVMPEVVDRSDWPTQIVIAYPLTGTEKSTLVRYESFHAHLAKELDIEIKPVATKGYVPIYVGFNIGQIDAAYMGPKSYIKLREISGANPVAMEVAENGRVGYRSVIVTNPNSGINCVEDARGKDMAMVDMDSTSGFLIPSVYLLKTFKTTPADFAGSIFFTKSHDALIEGIAKGDYIWGATNDIDLERVSKELKLDPESIKVIWTSETFPSSPFAVRKEIPDSLQKAFSDAMLSVNNQPEILSDLGISGFKKADDNTYGPVREIRLVSDPGS
jgi:phosphonate transport system substrate-binding protein